MLLPEKYESIFDVSSEGPSSVKISLNYNTLPFLVNISIIGNLNVKK